MQQNISQTNQNVSMDVLDNLMNNGSSSTGAGPSSLPTSAASGSQANQQLLVEQQIKLNQLQQLYQLQTQIFQQQVSFPSSAGSPARDERLVFWTWRRENLTDSSRI